MKKYAVISPHLDDGVLSCGDYIKKLIDDGNSVTLITVFTGYPPSFDLSEAGKEYHANCFLSNNSMEFRKKEDIQACRLLGCDYIHLDYYECLYRKDPEGNNIYPCLNNIYHLDEKSDESSIQKLIKEFLGIIHQFDCILAPLGLGEHADHLLLNKVMQSIDALNNNKILYYQDIPYICYMNEINKKITISGMKPVIVEISESEWQLKVQAILCYRSQLHVLWRNENELLKQLRAVSKMYGFNHAIRFWEMENEKQ